MTKEQLEQQNKALRAENKELRQIADIHHAEADKARAVLKEITDRDSADIYSRAVMHYGEPSRLLLAIEEMSELTKELVKHQRGRQNMSAISEEMADVEIMLEQLKAVFGNRAAVDIQKAQKLQRLADRLEGRND